MIFALLPKVLSTALSDSFRLLAAEMVDETSSLTFWAPRWMRSATRIPPAILPTSAKANPRELVFFLRVSTAAPAESAPPSTEAASFFARAVALSKPCADMSFETTRISTTLGPVGVVMQLPRQLERGDVQCGLDLLRRHVARAGAERPLHCLEPRHGERVNHGRLLTLDALERGGHAAAGWLLEVPVDQYGGERLVEVAHRCDVLGGGWVGDLAIGQQRDALVCRHGASPHGHPQALEFAVEDDAVHLARDDEAAGFGERHRLRPRSERCRRRARPA